MKYIRVIMPLILISFLFGCQLIKSGLPPEQDVASTFLGFNNSIVHKDLINLPEPKGKIIISSYSFMDESGQYKDPPLNSFSSALPQGIHALLTSALLNSKWFILVERENLQNLLTERKIMQSQGKRTIKELVPSSILIEGGVISFDSNIKTGGIGFRYLGIGSSSQYRMDQITIGLRAVNVMTGEIIDSVMTTKTIYSKELNAGIFKFVRYKQLLEFETGYTNNEPLMHCVNEAIESAVIRLVLRGIKRGKWSIKNGGEIDSQLKNRYLNDFL